LRNQLQTSRNGVPALGARARAEEGQARAPIGGLRHIS
jgi:hypothetical protein